MTDACLVPTLSLSPSFSLFLSLSPACASSLARHLIPFSHDAVMAARFVCPAKLVCFALPAALRLDRSR